MTTPQEAETLGSLVQVSTYQAGITQSTAQRLLKKFTDDCLRKYDLSTMQWFIIGTIYDAGEDGLTITSLSKIVDTNISYITNTLNKLQLKGIVVRKAENNQDNRTRTVHIHPNYTAFVASIEEDLRKEMRTTVYTHITPKELRTYIQVLRKLTTVLAAYK